MGVLGKLIGAGCDQRKCRIGLTGLGCPPLLTLPHTPLSPPARGMGFRGREAGEAQGVTNSERSELTLMIEMVKGRCRVKG